MLAHKSEQEEQRQRDMSFALRAAREERAAFERQQKLQQEEDEQVAIRMDRQLARESFKEKQTT